MKPGTGVRISASALIGMAAAWDERRDGGEGRCPACLEVGLKPGRVRVKVTTARGASYYCRRCGATVSARAIWALKRIQGDADENPLPARPPEAQAPKRPGEPIKGLLSAMGRILTRRGAAPEPAPK
jgi:hypothetical protein